MSVSLQMAELLRAARAAEQLESEPELEPGLEAGGELDASSEPVPAAEEAAAPAAAAPVVPGVAAPTLWSEGQEPSVAAAPSPEHVALPSASVGDLWGKPVELPRVQAVLDGLLPGKPQHGRVEVEKQIEKRAGELDRKWRGCDAAFRGQEVLRMGKRLPGEARAALAPDTERLARVDTLRRQLRSRMEEAEAVCQGQHPHGASVSGRDRRHAERTVKHCGRSLKRLEKVEEKVVEKAERTVDAQGLRLELLTQAESRLDPTAPREKRLGHLLSVWLGVFTGVMQEQRELEEQESREAESARHDAEEEERLRKALVRRLEQARPSLPTQTSEPLRIIRG